MLLAAAKETRRYRLLAGLPETIRWTNPSPPPRDNSQDPVTILVRDPSLREPSEDEAKHLCGGGRYFCLVHGQAYAYEQCGPGQHEIRWECNVHGPEAYGCDQLMVWNPNGFDPPLTEAQVNELLGE